MQPFTLSAALTDRTIKILRRIPDAYLHVNVAGHRMQLIRRGSVECEYPVSTSSFGMGGREGSRQTPPGIHRIFAKMGAGSPLHAIFRDRIDTGELWTPGTAGENLVLTRILRLEGLEEGVNRGPGIDSFDRCIYIHGTNKEDRVGTPLSHGCVVMKNRDITELFDRVEEGMLVIIDNGAGKEKPCGRDGHLSGG